MYQGSVPFNLNHDTLSQATQFLGAVGDVANRIELVSESPKVSFVGPGRYLDDREYAKADKLGGKYQVARLVVRKENSCGYGPVIQGTGPARRWENRDRRAFQRDRGEEFGLYLSKERPWHIGFCGRFGEWQVDAEGNEHYRVYKCQERRLCPSCRKAYQRGKATILTNQVNLLCRGVGLQIVYKPVYTFPEYIRDQIKTQNHLRAFERGVVEMIQGYYGCPKSRAKTYPKGSIGINISQHWISTSEPWKHSPHLHALIIPERIKGKTVSHVGKYMGKPDLQKMKRMWAKVVKRVAGSLGFSGVESIPKSLVVEWNYIKVLDADLQPTGNSLRLGYDLRCQVEDLQGCVVGVYPGDGSRLMQYEQNGTLYHVKLSRHDYINEKRKLMDMMRCQTRYGWLRRFKSVADLLGLEEISEPDPFIPVPGKTIQVEYRREYNWEWNKERHRMVERKTIFAKPMIAADIESNWIEIDPWRVHGEECFFASSRRYKVKAVTDLRLGDRGG